MGYGNAMKSTSANPTRFEKTVYNAVKLIPRGRVSTYRAVAEKTGCRSCQAVGQALKRNQNSPIIPCHRVISSNLTIGGFMGKRTGQAVKRKISLLSKEGVKFESGQLVDPSRLFIFK